MALDIFAAGMVGSRWAGRVAQQTLEPPVRMLLIRIMQIIVLEALGVPLHRWSPGSASQPSRSVSRFKPC